jgi:putative superfamily III holin-X
MSNNPNAPGRAYADDARSAESIPQLIRDLANDLSTLFSKELSLAKAEVREAASTAQKGVAAMAGGAVLAMSGVNFVLLAIVVGLANALPLWLSALIVGVVALIVGYAMAKAAQNKVKPAAFVPERATESVRKDAETAKRAMQ